MKRSLQTHTELKCGMSFSRGYTKTALQRYFTNIFGMTQDISTRLRWATYSWNILGDNYSWEYIQYVPLHFFKQSHDINDLANEKKCHLKWDHMVSVLCFDLWRNFCPSANTSTNESRYWQCWAPHCYWFKGSKAVVHWNARRKQIVLDFEMKKAVILWKK